MFRDILRKFYNTFRDFLIFLNISNISKNIHDDKYTTVSNIVGICGTTQRIDKTKQRNISKYLSISLKALCYMFRTKEIRLFLVFITVTIGNKDL